MDQATRDSLVDVLGREMSEISEESYCSGWLGDIEYIIPELCRRAIAKGHAVSWGRIEITLKRAIGLVYIADQIGSWVNYELSTDGWQPFQPFPIPSEIIAAIDMEQMK